MTISFGKQTTWVQFLFWGEEFGTIGFLTKSMSYKLKVSKQITPKELIMQKRQKGIRIWGNCEFYWANTMALRKAVTLLFITTDVSLVHRKEMLMNWIYRHTHSVDLKYLELSEDIKATKLWICIKIFPQETKLISVRDEYIENITLKTNAFILKNRINLFFLLINVQQKQKQ